MYNANLLLRYYIVNIQCLFSSPLHHGGYAKVKKKLHHFYPNLITILSITKGINQNYIELGPLNVEFEVEVGPLGLHLLFLLVAPTLIHVIIIIYILLFFYFFLFFLFFLSFLFLFIFFLQHYIKWSYNYT